MPIKFAVQMFSSASGKHSCLTIVTAIVEVAIIKVLAQFSDGANVQ